MLLIFNTPFSFLFTYFCYTDLYIYIYILQFINHIVLFGIHHLFIELHVKLYPHFTNLFCFFKFELLQDQGFVLIFDKPPIQRIKSNTKSRQKEDGVCEAKL
jgi:hypothetical protein